MRNLKFTLLLILMSGTFTFTNAQSVLDPGDPIVNYNSSSPPVQPPWGQIGKWVRTPRLPWWNTDSYKCYIYKGIQFRLKFPKSYNPVANDGKKYPMIAFWHGLLEAGDIYDNEFQMLWGGDFFRHAVDNNVFDGYVIFMQASTAGGSFFAPGHFEAMRELIDYMVANNKLDQFRVTSNGLSSGAIGTWQMFLDNPTYVSNIIAMSAPGNWQDANVIDKTKFTPLWYSNGGQDTNPAPTLADQNVAAWQAAGMNYVRYFYPPNEHNTWEATWGEPLFWPTVNWAYASNPWALFGKTRYNAGETVNSTIGLAPGFDEYQWRKDGVVIPGATTRSIQATSFGYYEARVRKGTLWSDWSKKPVHIRLNNFNTKIQAESFTAMSGIGTETTQDAGGGLNVGWQDPNDWMDYSVNVPSAGAYTVNFRVATYFSNIEFQLRKSDGTVLTNVIIPHSGDWQKWITVSAIVPLQAGTQTLRIMTTGTQGGWNINWWEIDGSSTGPAPPPPPPSNVPPVVNAGTDQNITLPTSSVNLSGSATDAGGSISSYAWIKASGPAGANIVSPTTAATQVTGLVEGTYVFRLTAVDNGGASSSDDVTVTVTPAASAGAVKIQAENYIAMSGIATENTADVGGGLNVGWQDTNDWMDYSVNLAAGGTRTINFRVASFFSGAQFQLRNASGTVLATLTCPNTGSFQTWTTISVQVGLPAGPQTLRIFTSNANGGWNFNWWEIGAPSSTPNTPPTANAGLDQSITLPTSNVNLSGSGNDTDGSIASYSWAKFSGPAGGTIASPNSAATTVTGLNQGTYVFRLTVTDNLGAQATDDVQVTVNPGAPSNTVFIEAENYSSMSGIGTEPTADVGGGLNVGWQDNGDFMNYSVNLLNSGSRTVRFRVASFFTGAQFQLRNNAGTVLATLTVPNTGSFQSWTTISTTVNLPSGAQTLRIHTSNANGGWNLNWWEIGAPAGARENPNVVAQVPQELPTRLSIFPNPVTDRMQLMIAGSYKGDLKVRIVNVAGVQVKQYNLNKPSSDDLQIGMQLNDLKSGVYLIQVSNGITSETIRMSKL